MHPCKIYPYQITATIEDTTYPLQLIAPSETRILVGATIKPSNQLEHVLQSLQDKVQGLC